MIAPPEVPDPGARPQKLTEMLQAMRELILAGERFRTVAGDHLGLGSGEILILSLIGAPSPMIPSELAQKTGRKPSTLTAALDRLETAGMISRGQHPTDRRKTVVYVSAQGRQALTWLREFSDDAFGDMDAEAIDGLTSTLKTVATAIDAEGAKITD